MSVVHLHEYRQAHVLVHDAFTQAGLWRALSAAFPCCRFAIRTVRPGVVEVVVYLPWWRRWWLRICWRCRLDFMRRVGRAVEPLRPVGVQVLILLDGIKQGIES